MINDYPIEECIRGHSAHLSSQVSADPKNPKSPKQLGYEVLPQNMQRPRRARPGEVNKAGEVVLGGLDAATTRRAVAELPGVRPQTKRAGDVQHAGTRGGRVHDGDHGRAELPRRARCCSGTRSGASRWTPTRAGRRSGRRAARSAASRTRSPAGHGGDKGSTLHPPEYRSWPGRGSTARTRPRRNGPAACGVAARYAASGSLQEMGLRQHRPPFRPQVVKDLLVVHPLVDHLGDPPAGGVRHPAAVRVAARQGVEVAGADVIADLAGAVDAREEPLDASSVLGGCGRCPAGSRCPGPLSAARAS